MTYLRGAAVLVGSALVVMLGVAALARALVPQPPPTEPPVALGLPSERPTEADDDHPLPAGQTAIPREQPIELGGVLEVTGDRPGTILLQPRHMRFGSGRYQVGDGSAVFYMTFDLENGWHPTQVTYSGLNLFLDPNECPFAPVDSNEETGLARYQVSCPSLTDVRGAEAISIAGWVDGPLIFAATDGRYDSGATMTLSGDLDAELHFPSAVWYRYPEGWGYDADETGLTIGGDDPEVFFSFSIHFQPGDGLPSLTGLAYDQSVFRADDCDVSLESQIKVAPNTDLLTLDVDCEVLTELEGPATVSATGTIRLHLVDVELDEHGRPTF